MLAMPGPGYDAEMGVVAVTGGSAGVGRAIAQAFGSRGDRVALLAREGERLAAAEKELISAGAPATLALSIDVADATAVDDAAQRIERGLGPIDNWINNAMTSGVAPFWEI